MSSDKRVRPFLTALRENGRLTLLLLLLLCGAALIVFGGRYVDGDGESESLDDRVAELCSQIEGVGDCRVMLTITDAGEVVSAAVLCEGGASVSVRASVTELISELFGIGSNRISVLKLAK